MSWPPSPQYPAYPEPPERPYPGYSGQSGQSYPERSGQAYPGQSGQGYPDQYGQTYPGQSGQGYPDYPQNPGQGYPGQSGQGYPGQSAQGYPDYPQNPGQGYPGQSGQGYPDYPEQPTQPHSGYPQQSGQSYPGYSQSPADPYPGYASHQKPPAPKKSKAGMIALIVLAVVLVACGGGGTAVYFALKDPVKDAVEAVNTRVVAPDTLAGRAKSTNPELQSAAKGLEDSMRADLPEAKDVVGGFYGEPEKQDMLMVAAASGLIADPGKELDDAIKEAGTSGLEITGVKAVDPGPLGGEARCGDAETDGLEMAVCVWADKGSLGMVVIYFTKADEKAAAEFVKIRGEIEQRD